jgi:hypothetical protein
MRITLMLLSSHTFEQRVTLKLTAFTCSCCLQVLLRMQRPLAAAGQEDSLVMVENLMAPRRPRTARFSFIGIPEESEAPVLVRFTLIYRESKAATEAALRTVLREARDAHHHGKLSACEVAFGGHGYYKTGQWAIGDSINNAELFDGHDFVKIFGQEQFRNMAINLWLNQCYAEAFGAVLGAKPDWIGQPPNKTCQGVPYFASQRVSIKAREVHFYLMVLSTTGMGGKGRMLLYCEPL